MLTKSFSKVASKFFCDICNYNTSKKSSYDKHLLTSKHTKLTFVNNVETKSCYDCDNSNKFFCKNCNKEYKSRVGLWKHKKICQNTNDTTEEPIKQTECTTDKDKLIDYLIQEHSELKNLILEIVKKDTVTNNNTINSHNKSFNLQFFLNETCKDAMNIMDFVESIQLQLSDLEKVGELGYVEGISNIIIKNLKGLDVTQRPIHCTDKKREVLYVKDEDLWQKEDEQNKTVRTAIKKITDKNMRLIPQYKKINPDCNKSDSKVSDKYNTIVVESMGGKGENYFEKENKIISNISKQVIVEKEKELLN
jgi:hypothetical protein